MKVTTEYTLSLVFFWVHFSINTFFFLFFGGRLSNIGCRSVLERTTKESFLAYATAVQQDVDADTIKKVLIC